jgi:Zn-dependent protease with chaperone function
MRASGLVRSVSIEITAHAVVLALILVPILGIISPALLFILGETVISAFLSERLNMPVGTRNFEVLMCGASLGAIAVGVLAIRWNERNVHTSAPLKTRPLKGKDGQRLTQIVSELTEKMGGLPNGPPLLCWFSSMDVAAYAVHMPLGPQIQLSAGLWRAIIMENRSAWAILAHEIAHLRFSDPVIFKWLERLYIATRAILLLTTAMAVAAIAAVCFDLGSEAWQSTHPGAALASTALKILLASISVLVIIPLSWLALRRQAAFITSLIEIRADIAAAVWTNGLEHFTQAFADNHRVHRSTRWQMLQAVFSPTLSHIPERERLQILRNPVSICTPKIRFFALSLFLAFVLPINFCTPLLWHGALNSAAMLGLSIAFNCTLAAMVLSGFADTGRVALPAFRTLQLAVASCVITALPRINLEPLSYLVMSWSVGFGGTALDLQQLGRDALSTWLDVRNRFGVALFDPQILLAVGIAYAALKWLAHNAAKAKARVHGLILPLTCTAFATLVAGLDKRVSLSVSGRDQLLHWMTVMDPVSVLMLCLPLLAAALAHNIQSRW